VFASTYITRKDEQQKKVDVGPKQEIFKIVLTGGPCGGKSSALTRVVPHLEGLGFRVYLIPEAATLLFTAGVPIPRTTNEILAFQGNLMKTQMHIEDVIYDLAVSSKKPSVVICDRGAMDSRAYCTQEVWELIQAENKFNDIDLRDRRYDAVIHLVTAAIGAEKYYTTSNNQVRTETIEEARALDFRILNAWLGHKNVRVVDNSTDFAGKINRVINNICAVVGVPYPDETVRRYKLKGPPNFPAELERREFDVEQTYLSTKKTEKGTIETKIRKRTANAKTNFDYTIKQPSDDPGKHSLVEKTLSAREYVNLLQQADPQRSIVKKKSHELSIRQSIFCIATLFGTS